MTCIAMDVHKTRSTLAYRAPRSSEVVSAKCLTRREDLARAISGLPRPWLVIVECSRESPPVCKWLREMGVDHVRLANAEELARFTKGKPKTDARDAKTMLELFEAGRLAECYLADEEVQDRRALSRGRQSCRSISTQLRNIIRALLTQHGLSCSFKDLTGKSAEEELERLMDELPRLSSFMLRHLVGLLMHVESILSGLDGQIEEEVAGDEVAQALTEVAGIGPIIAFGLWSELGEIERFEDPKRLNSYAGLAPRANDSDEHCGPRHLPQRCNKRLRYWAILAAQSAANRKRPSRARRTYMRVKRRHRANVGKIAAARVVMQEVFYRWHAAIDEIRAVA